LRAGIVQRRVCPLSLFCLIFFAWGSNASAGNLSPDLKQALRSLGPDEEVAVVVAFRDKADIHLFKDPDKKLRRWQIIHSLKAKAELTQRPLETFLKERGAKRIIPLWIKNGMAVTARSRVVLELADHRAVESISLDETVRVPSVSYGVSAKAEWNVKAIHATRLWALGYTGQGIVVASIDSGVDLDHPDLKTRWRGGTNSWYDPNGEHDTPFDANGHGTNVMGIIVGGNASGTAIGVAPDAKWIAVKIFNDGGVASLSVIHQGFQWLLDPDGNPGTDDAPDVVNVSWALEGVNRCSLEFQSDIEALESAGIAIVFSAGNDGPLSSTSASPANSPGAFGVGAVSRSKHIASFSSRGPSACDGGIYPAVVAPGVNVKTSDLTEGGVFTDSYVLVMGTSFAAPHVAGAMALLLNAFPSLTVPALEFVLKESALDLGARGADNTYGYGFVNVMKAYNDLLHPEPKIAASASAYQFGPTEIGATSSQTLTIFNLGMADLSIESIVLSGSTPSEFNLESDSCSQRNLTPLSSCTLDIGFSPIRPGARSKKLKVSSNDPSKPTLNLSLKGIGIKPDPFSFFRSSSEKFF